MNYGFFIMRYNKNLLVVALLFAVVLIAGCSGQSQQTTQPDTTPTDTNEISPGDFPASENTVQDPSTVSAVVNGESITVGEVTSFQQLYEQQGQQLPAPQALDQLINQKIVVQEANNQGYTVTDAEAQSVIETQLTAQGLTLEQYQQQLEAQGLSFENELARIKEQVLVQTYLDEAVDTNISVSEEEIQQMYASLQEASPEQVPPRDEIEEQLIASVQQQKRQEAISELIGQLRADAVIE